MNVRRPTWDDLPAMLAVARAADTAVVGESDWTEEDLRDELAELDLERDAWLFELDGRVAGFANYENRRGRLIADGYVDPELRGRGIGTTILDLTEARAREDANGSSPRLQNATLNNDEATARFYEARGYERVRHFWRMVADLESPPDVPALPDGVELRPYRHPDEARVVHATLEEAFLDHWENRPRPYDDWAKRQFAPEHFDPTLWWVVTDGDELVGAVACEWKRHGDWGWVAILGVRRPWRGKGIGDTLLRTAFAEFFRRGERRIALGVDAQSPTGATRLYERVGMRVFWEAVVWEKEIA